MNYFRLAEVKGIFEELDGWIRRLPAVHYLAAMETHPQACQRTDETRPGQRSGLEVSNEWARPMVECRSLAHERCLYKILL